MIEFLHICKLFDLDKTIARELFEGKEFPFEALPEISDFIYRLGKTLPKDKFDEISEGVWAAKSASIAKSAYLGAPCIIDEGAEVRHCAFIRGSAIIGRGAVLGNSCEIKNSVLFDGAQIPHFNYVGDSIIGHLSHLGAGAITSNVKSDKTNVKIKLKSCTFDTCRKKVGAMVGDGVEVGCGSVLNPGTVIGRGARVYPLSSTRGYIPENSIYKNKNEIVIIKE